MINNTANTGLELILVITRVGNAGFVVINSRRKINSKQRELTVIHVDHSITKVNTQQNKITVIHVDSSITLLVCETKMRFET